MTAMDTGRVPSPKQFKVPIGSKRRRKPPAGKRARRKVPDEQQLVHPKLLASPRPKAVCPYTPSTDLEDFHLRSLINYCKFYHVTFVTAATLTNVGPRFEWYGLAVRDETFFHALISSTCAHYSYMTGLELPYKWIFFRHRGEAIRVVNQRIAQGRHDEGTINAIIVFAQQDSFEDHPEESKRHMDGLVHLVQAAGGLSCPDLSDKTRRHLCFVDLAAAIIANSKPHFPPMLDMTNLEPYFGKPNPAASSHIRSFGARLYNFTGSLLSDQAANVLWGLRSISELVEAFRDNRATPDTASASDIQFTDRVEVLERLVHSLWFVRTPAAPQHILFRTFGYTCLIYIYTIFRELPMGLNMNSMLARKVKLALETCAELNVLLATFPDLLLWEMFLCGRAAESRDKPFLAQQVTKILMVKKLEDTKDIVAASNALLWPERGAQAPLVAVGPHHTPTEVIEIDDT
ncbi:hypothetical protein N431DRAFT_499520 [Stipitochalara longipes BDJ]|nr:hypothetical protein N431DRAFT_499520 [Stipitochalara longipes BDJ]